MARGIVELRMVNQLPHVIAVLPGAADDLARALSPLVVDGIRNEAPKRTEALSVSAYEVFSDGSSTYAAATANVAGRNPTAQILPEAPPPPVGQVIIPLAVNYASVVHDGGANRAANQFLARAMDGMRPRFDAEAQARWPGVLAARIERR
jgi:hypothetical protein